MAHPKTTSKRVASVASRVLRSIGPGKVAKTVAGSALGQKHGRKHKK